MSKIINKKQLDFLIESTMEEYGQEKHGHIGDIYQGENPHVMRDMARHNPEDASNYDLYLRKSKNKGTQTPSQEDIDSAMNYVSYMKDGMCECGAMMYEGICEAGCGSQMEEGKKDIKNPGKYMGKAKQKAGVDYDGDGVPNGADKDPKDGDVTEASVKDLAESVTKTFNPSFLTEDMDNFKKLINYRNK